MNPNSSGLPETADVTVRCSHCGLEKRVCVAFFGQSVTINQALVEAGFISLVLHGHDNVLCPSCHASYRLMLKRHDDEVESFFSNGSDDDKSCDEPSHDVADLELGYVADKQTSYGETVYSVVPNRSCTVSELMEHIESRSGVDLAFFVEHNGLEISVRDYSPNDGVSVNTDKYDDMTVGAVKCLGDGPRRYYHIDVIDVWEDR